MRALDVLRTALGGQHASTCPFPMYECECPIGAAMAALEEVATALTREAEVHQRIERGLRRLSSGELASVVELTVLRAELQVLHTEHAALQARWLHHATGSEKHRKEACRGTAERVLVAAGKSVCGYCRAGESSLRGGPMVGDWFHAKDRRCQAGPIWDLNMDALLEEPPT